MGTRGDGADSSLWRQQEASVGGQGTGEAVLGLGRASGRALLPATHGTSDGAGGAEQACSCCEACVGEPQPCPSQLRKAGA